MASKNKRPHDRKGAARPAVQHDIGRLIEKGRYKDAIKEAKLVYRQESTPENHRLLEKAYFLRAEQLQQAGMTSSAQEVAGQLLEFGITDPALTEPAAALMMTVGMAGRALELQARIETPEARDRLLKQAADQAVLHPEKTPASLAEIRAGAIRIRQSLDALAAGDESRSLDGLRDLPRTSPFSEWKLLVRGLVAFQRRDAAEAQANWDRLDPGRVPSRIASALSALDRPEPVRSANPPAQSQTRSPNLDALERLAFGEPVLKPLGEMSALVAGHQWTEALRVMAPLRFALQRIDPKLAVRLTQILYGLVLSAAMEMDFSEAQKLLKGFSRVAEPLPIDPRWNRLWALAWEGPHGHILEAEPFWKNYLDDLETSPALRSEERPQAKALVWLHLGKELVSLADELAEEGLPSGTKIDPDLKDSRRNAVDCFEKSLKLFPAHRPTYEALRDAYKDWDEPEKAAAINRRLVHALPDDFDALIELTDYHFNREELNESLGYALKARALKPLDKKARMSEWACHTALARRNAIEGRYDDGRAAFQAAERLEPALSRGLHFLARKAAFEIKAGQPDKAAEFIDEALKIMPEPTPFWLALDIELSRFKAAKADRDRYEAHWINALPKKVRSETAGALAELLASFQSSQITYPGLKTHIKQVQDYLGRTTRIKYAREDLGLVIGFLKLTKGKLDLQEKLAKRGVKLFPAAPEFLVGLGAIEIEKGPARGNLRQARLHLEAAQKLAQAHATTDPRAAELLPIIKGMLTTLQDIFSAGPFGLPFGGRGGGFVDMIEEMMEAGMLPEELFGDDFDDDDEDDTPRPRGGPSKKTRKR